MISPNQQIRSHADQSSQKHQARGSCGITIGPWASSRARQIAIHLEDSQFSRALDVVRLARKEHREAKRPVPTTLAKIRLEDAGLKERTFRLMYDSGFRTVDDIVVSSDERLLSVQTLGRSMLRELRGCVDLWIDRIVEGQGA